MAAGGALMARADGGISMSVLQRYEWPGNARALGNVMERAAIVARTRHLSISPLLKRDQRRFRGLPQAAYIPLFLFKNTAISGIWWIDWPRRSSSVRHF
jgi:DNA-binding NtrC family response regulator